MAALVQTYPQQATVTMLHSRPSSSGGYTPTQAQQHLASRNASAQRYNPSSGSGGYRGMPSHGPVAPYAFTSTPQLTNPNSLSRQHHSQSSHLRGENRTLSAPVIPHTQQGSLSTGAVGSARQQYPTASPISHSPSSPSLAQPTPRSMDDSSISSRSPLTESSNRPRSMLELSASSSMTSANSMSPAKPSPDRYRRNVRRMDSSDSAPHRTHHTSAMPSGSGMAAVGHLYTHPSQSNSSPTLRSYQSHRGTSYSPGDQTRQASKDDMTLVRPPNAELAKRYRRRSLGNLETAGLNHTADAQRTASPHPNTFIPPPSPGQSRDSRAPNPPHRPTSLDAHNGSSESVSSTRSGQSAPPQYAKNDRASNSTHSPSIPAHPTTVTKQEVKSGNVPRIVDASKRSTTPSPLSKPVNMTNEDSTTVPAIPVTSAKAPVPQQPSVVASPATQQLTAVSQKDAKKSKSKLRRAFSFGSSSELRRASAQNNMDKTHSSDPALKRNSKYEDELEPEQAKIAQKQEAGGLGESIYSGQGHFFTGSTDNLSISSTASSASIMLRKMSKGVKKSTRSLVGLFRPKSVVGVPAADGPVNHASAAQVSMVTVEAEPERVNVNANPHDQPGGGTGFPKLERNSLDAKDSVDSGRMSNETRPRRSIVGGERERAEVLAAVKKGILKRSESGQSSPVMKPLDHKVPDFNLPQIPHFNDSPHSSAPSTPEDDQPPRSGHRRTDSITVEGAEADYFSSVTHFTSLDPSNNTLLTPEGAASRNISFSPRIQFHDTWTSGEYDRRGEIATCNRLTPMLAQQIKEELNTFKMEMEVHESSKVYTHFF